MVLAYSSLFTRFHMFIIVIGISIGFTCVSYRYQYIRNKTFRDNNRTVHILNDVPTIDPQTSTENENSTTTMYYNIEYDIISDFKFNTRTPSEKGIRLFLSKVKGLDTASFTSLQSLMYSARRIWHSINSWMNSRDTYTHSLRECELMKNYKELIVISIANLEKANEAIRNRISAILYHDLGSLIVADIRRCTSRPWSLEIYGADNGFFTTLFSASFPESSVLSFFTGSKKTWENLEMTVSLKGLRNTVISSLLYRDGHRRKHTQIPFDDREVQRGPTVLEHIISMSNSPEFFEFQIFNFFHSWTSVESKWSDLSLNGTACMAVGNTISTAAITYMFLPFRLVLNNWLKVCLNTAHPGSIVKTKYIKRHTINSEHVVLLKVELVYMIKQTKRLVKSGCIYRLSYENGEIFQEKMNDLCNGYKKLKDAGALKSIRHNSGTSLATMNSLSISLYSRLRIMGMIVAYTGPPWVVYQTSSHNLLCCRGGVITGIDKAFFGPLGTNAIRQQKAHCLNSSLIEPKFTRSVDMPNTLSSGFPKTEPYPAGLDLTSAIGPYPAYDYDYAGHRPERLQWLFAQLFNCYTNWFPQQPPPITHRDYFSKNYCQDFNGLTNAQICIFNGINKLILQSLEKKYNNTRYSSW